MRTKFLPVFLIGFAVEGCADNPTAPSAVQRPLSLALASQAMKISHAPIRQRFGGISVDALTPIRLGKPVEIEVSAPVIVDSKSAHLKVLLPELSEIAYRQKFGFNGPAPPVTGSHLTWHGQVSRGTLRQKTRLVFPVPGLYRISAQLMTDDPSLDEEGQIQNTSGTVSWVYVTLKAGRMLHTFGDLYADREASQAMTPVDAYLADPKSSIGVASMPLPCDPADPSCSPCATDPYSCGPAPSPTPAPGTFTGTLFYDNQRVHATVPLANALMSIFDDRGGGWYSQVSTDETGKFTLECPAASLRGHLQLVATARNAFTEVRDVNSAAPPPDLSYYRPQADAAIDRCGTDTGIYRVDKPAQAELFDNMTRTAQKSRQTFPGFSRGQIQVHWRSGTTDIASGYSPTDDVIEIYEPRSVGEVGLFEAAHEYGHALHQAALGGIIISDASAQGCQLHNIAGITSYQCAFVEGFAHYHAVAIWGTQIGTARFNEFDKGQHAGFPTRYGPTSRTGPQTEGAVASTLLHVGDGTGARSVTGPFGIVPYTDAASLGHSQVAGAIRDCRVILADGSSVKADGIDYLSYCLEKAVQMYVPKKQCNIFGSCYQPPAFFMPIVDPLVSQTAFNGLRATVLLGRTIGPPNATSWAWGTVPNRVGYDGNVRTIWACNLFSCA